MLQTGGGSVIVTGSPTGLFGLAPTEHAYSASKAGLTQGTDYEKVIQRVYEVKYEYGLLFFDVETQRGP